MKPEDCKKYEKCNANICPLDERWRERSHLRGEPVCLWLREWSKAGGEERIRERTLPLMADLIGTAYREITSPTLRSGSGHGDIARVLRYSGKTGSLLAAGDRLKTPPARSA